MTPPLTPPGNGIPPAIPIPAAAGPTPATERIALVPPPPTLEYERITVKLAAIQFDLLNAHKHSDEYIGTLAANIAERGLINEPLVRPDPKTGLYLLVAGEARVRAMTRLSWETTYVRCLKGTFTAQQYRDLALIDNLLTESIDPLALGLFAKDEMARSGRSARELAKVLNNKVNASTITRAVALVNKLPEDLHELIRCRKLPPGVARRLTAKNMDDTAKRHYAALYCEGKVKSGDELAKQIKADKSGQAPTPAGFTCEESGVKIAFSWASGITDTQVLANVETALRAVLKDLAGQKHRGVAHWKNYLEKKAKAAKKAADLAEAQQALAQVANPATERSAPAN